MVPLVDRKCVHRKASEGLDQRQIDEYLLEVPNWTRVEVDSIEQIQSDYKFKNFAQALEFSNKVGAISEEEDHHPAILTEWGRVRVAWWTHTVKGLSENDFIMAAKTDALFDQR